MKQTDTCQTCPRPSPLAGAVQPLRVPTCPKRQVLEQANKLISLEPTFVSTTNTAQQRLTRAAGAYASSQEALGRPVGRLLAASGRLEALLAVEESARNQEKLQQQQQQQH